MENAQKAHQISAKASKTQSYKRKVKQKNNLLYGKRNNRYLKQRRLKPVTICIAAICDRGSDLPPKILFCSDRAVSTTIQFEAGESKIKKITEWCYIMQSSNHSLLADLILERVISKAQNGKYKTVLAITELLRDECIAFKIECLERDILSKYNKVSEQLEIPSEAMVKMVKDEVADYDNDFRAEYIVAGLEPTNEAHLYEVNQDGEYFLGDSLGYLTIGSGGELAFYQITRYVYSRSIGMIYAIPLIYVAKKVSERAIGVGRATDFYVLHLPDPKNFKPLLYDLSQNEKCMKELDKTYVTILKKETATFRKTCDQMKNLFPQAIKD